MSRKLPWNWRKRLEIVIVEDSQDYNFHIQFQDEKEVKGFLKEIGILAVKKEPPHFVTLCQVDEDFRRKGLATQLYEFALDHLGQLSTHYYNAEKPIQKIWKKLAITLDMESDFWSGTLTIHKKNGKDSQKK